MTRLTPRRLVSLIERTYPWTATGTQGVHDGTTRADQAASLGMIAKLARQLPPDLAPTDPDDYLALFASCEAIDAQRELWAGMAPLAAEAQPLRPLPAFGNRAPVKIIRDVLAKCPEEGIRAETHDLQFVSDAALRDGLRRDLSSTRSTLEHGEFKAATVLGGSVIEALLLNAVEPLSAEQRDRAFAEWKRRDKREGEQATASLPADVNRWTLQQLIWIARCANIISENAAALADVVRDYRNLVHPGKERLRLHADEGSAHAALAAVLRVASELQARSRRV